MAVTCSLTGASELKMGESSSSLFSPGGVHRVMSHPIGMKTKPRRRTGLAGGLVSAGAAGSKGPPDSYTPPPAAPRPKKGRGGGRFFLYIRTQSSRVIGGA